ncbi:MAG: cation-translocating P-type ATPase, partial [Armatimonadetes bacterium]|nr:cation-translocating P-type ATPase [Armatimonadota bacterium]
VYAGSLNGKGSLEVRVTNTAEENTLARIVHMVEEAQAQKAPTQRFSETFGRYYTPCVIALAAAIPVLGMLVFGGHYEQWIGRSLTLLVVSCPCALVISTPVAIVAAIANAARCGVLIKGGAYLEALGEVSVVAFDKTGTLTTGKLSVCDVTSFDERKPEEVLAIAAAVESRSEHPLADAIVEHANEIGVRQMAVSYFEALPGKGARAVADGELYYVGNRRLMDQLRMQIPESEAVAEMLARGCTVVYVADERQPIGAIGATDTVKPRAAQAISELKQIGIRRTVLLTGDTRQSAIAVANLLDVDETHAQLLPQDKVELVRRLGSGRDRIAMVGDGINDAPALAAAHVGIAMGGVGSHAAVEAADITLMADDIVMLPYAVSLARRARRIITQNLAFAVAVVVALIVGALTNHVTLTTGVLGHEGSALLVIANSIRLLTNRTV